MQILYMFEMILSKSVNITRANGLLTWMNTHLDESGAPNATDRFGGISVRKAYNRPGYSVRAMSSRTFF